MENRENGNKNGKVLVDFFVVDFIFKKQNFSFFWQRNFLLWNYNKNVLFFCVFFKV